MPDNQARRRAPAARSSAAPGPAPGLPARRAALRLLDAVLRRGEALDAALAGAVRDVPAGPDRALAHALAAATLRRLPDLDALIDSATRLRLADDAKARMVLRLALAGRLVLGTPPHAAIATALPLVDGGPRKLVHGVLSTLFRQGDALPAVPTLPAPVAARWREAWGEPVVEAAARAIAAPPPLDLTLREDGFSTSLEANGNGNPQSQDPFVSSEVETPPVSLAPRHLRLHEAAPVPELPGFAEGAWWVQDLAASIPARLIGPGSGTALDLCAAPGGKTLQLAAAGWRVTAVDASASRLDRLRENLARTHLTAEVVTADLLDWAPAAPVDAVLLDAPCSATGIFRRHPDVLHRARPAIVAEMAALQQALLARAADWVRPGGTLVYATCSLERAEGEAQAEAFRVARRDFAVAPAGPGELPAGIVPTPEGYVRTLPGTLAEAGGCDGFFVARFVRASA